MRRVALVAAAIALLSAEGNASADLRFHHLHLTSGIDFYARLFDRSATRRDSLAGFDALRSGSMLILFGVPDRPNVPERQSAIWHFGWGDVSSGETYLRHAAREVEWEPPLPAGKLHLHLVSTSPAATAAWYRDRLHAEIEVMPGTVNGGPLEPRPELRTAEALVRVAEFAMLIYRTDETLVSTRGQRADHVALGCDDLDETLARLQSAGVTVLSAPRPFAGGRAAMIEGPDLIAIELIEN